MSEIIHMFLELAVSPSNSHDWNTLKQEMIEATSKESHTLVYEWYFHDTRGTWHIHERYADQDACDLHVDGFVTHFGERFLALAEGLEIRVYGNPSGKVREILAGLRPTYFTLGGGFNRA